MGCASSLPVSVLDEIREIEHAGYPRKIYKINSSELEKESYITPSTKQYNSIYTN